MSWDSWERLGAVGRTVASRTRLTVTQDPPVGVLGFVGRNAIPVPAIDRGRGLLCECSRNRGKPADGGGLAYNGRKGRAR